MTKLRVFISSPLRRQVVLGVLVVASVALLVVTLRSQPPGAISKVGTTDYVQYWAASRLLLQQGNPYDSALMLATERSAGAVLDDPIMMWNPPWTLAILLPFAVLSFAASAKVWLALQIVLVLACGALLWRTYAPQRKGSVLLGILVAASFVPGILALQMGQISPWLLCSVTGFILAYTAKQDFLAGIALLPLTYKPHIAYLFLVGILVWILREKRWKVLVGGVAAWFGSCSIVGVISPAVFSQYLRAAASPPLYWRSATLGAWLRTFFGSDIYWLQFLPPILGLVGFIVWVLRYKGKWDWLYLAPGLLLASVITSAYGWGFDQVILLPVAIVIMQRLREMPRGSRLVVLGIYILAQLMIIIQTQRMVDSAATYWFPLVLAVFYLFSQGNRRITPSIVRL